MSTATATPPGIDLERVVPWLCAHVEGLRAPLHFSRVGEGQSNLTFRVRDAAGRDLVLRRPPLGDVLESAHDMLREHHVMARLAAAGMPVPRPLALCDDPAVTGARFFVMEHVAGLALTARATVLGLSESARSAAGLGLAATLAHLQAVDIDAAGLSDLRRTTPYGARQLRRWQHQWEASRTRELPVVDELGARFAAGMPASGDSVLVHGDFHFGNVLAGPDGSLRALLDWELCTVGTPLADVGLMVAYYTEMGLPAGRPDGVFREQITSLAGFPSSDALVGAYAEATGRDVSAVPFWVAFAYWKVAIILEGVYRRWRNNPANGSGAGALGAAVERVAGLAAASADVAGI